MRAFFPGMGPRIGRVRTGGKLRQCGVLFIVLSWYMYVKVYIKAVSYSLRNWEMEIGWQDRELGSFGGMVGTGGEFCFLYFALLANHRKEKGIRVGRG